MDRKPKLDVRSPTIAVNVVRRTRGDDLHLSTFVNTFVDGVPQASTRFERHMTLADALIWLGTQMKLGDDPDVHPPPSRT